MCVCVCVHVCVILKINLGLSKAYYYTSNINSFQQHLISETNMSDREMDGITTSE